MRPASVFTSFLNELIGEDYIKDANNLEKLLDYKDDKQASFRSFAELCVTRQLITAVKTATRRKHTPLNNYISLNKPVYEDENAPALRNFGASLGRFIYIMDACVDFKDDLKHGRYNPLSQMTISDFEPMLCMLLADCTEKFAALNIGKECENEDILENILYCGVWMKYNAKYISKSESAGEENDV